MKYLKYKLLHTARQLKYKRISSGVPPLTLQNAIAGNLLNYQIYGNSVQDGVPSVDNPVEIENVGDKTKNLFDFSKVVNPNDIANGKVLEAYKNGVKVQGNESSTPGTLAFANGWFRPGDRAENVHCRVYAEAGTDIYISADVVLLQQYNDNSNIMRIYALGASNITSQSSTIRLVLNQKTRVSQKITVDKTGEYYPVFTLCSNTVLIENIMVSKSSDTNYEPYGYKNPITVNNQTTNIYLDEPLRAKDDSVDYIDYKNKKVVRNVNSKLLSVIDVPTIKLSGYSIGRNISYFRDAPTIAFSPLCEYLIGINQTNYTVANTITHYKSDDQGQTSQMLCCIPQSVLGTSDTSTSSEIVNAINNWASNNNIYVYYPLATPIEESIELPDVAVQNETNILDVDTTVKPSNVEIEYFSKEKE